VLFRSEELKKQLDKSQEKLEGVLKQYEEERCYEDQEKEKTKQQQGFEKESKQAAKPPKSSSLRKKSETEESMDVDQKENGEEEESHVVVAPKKTIKKSTSGAKMRQTNSKSKMASVEENDVEYMAPPQPAFISSKVQTEHAMTSSSSLTSLKSSSSKSKLVKQKKQSTLDEETPIEINTKSKPKESNPTRNSCILLDDSGDEANTKRTSKPTKPTKSSISAAKPKEKPEVGIKKKSTFNRLADLVSKSPIIEQLRRPQRQSKLKSSASNVSDCTNLSTATSSTVGAKLKAAAVVDALTHDDDDEDLENMNPVAEESKTRKAPSRKKKLV